MKKLSKFLILVFAVLLLITPVLASTGAVDATLYYRDIKVTVDGEAVTPTDVDGKAVEPFIIDGTTYVPMRALSEALGYGVEWDDATSTISITTDGLTKGTLLKALLNKMGDYETVAAEQYNKYFKSGSAADGVAAIVAAGNFYVNGFAVPATEEACAALYPNGYLVNGSAWLSKTDEGWKVDRTTYATYAEAAAAVPDRAPAGIEFQLYDTDADGCADRIDVLYIEALIVNKITVNADGNYVIDRGDLDPAITYSENDGRYFDGAHFSATSGEIIKAANFDATIEVGDMAVFWYETDGWHMQRAIEDNGILVEGIDHQYYNIDGTQYPDAMRFSRDNIIISNRNGEFANAHQYFGLMNNAEGLNVSLWLTPVSDFIDIAGAPAGLTSNENAAAFLAKAIAVAKEKLAAVTVSADGTDVAKDAKWTTQAAYDELSAAIARAEASLTSSTDDCQMDYQIYILYLTLNGNEKDIGAKFAGYNYAGFDKQVSAGVK